MQYKDNEQYTTSSSNIDISENKQSTPPIKNADSDSGNDYRDADSDSGNDYRDADSDSGNDSDADSENTSKYFDAVGNNSEDQDLDTTDPQNTNGALTPPNADPSSQSPNLTSKIEETKPTQQEETDEPTDEPTEEEAEQASLSQSTHLESELRALLNNLLATFDQQSQEAARIRKLLKRLKDESNLKQQAGIHALDDQHNDVPLPRDAQAKNLKDYQKQSRNLFNQELDELKLKQGASDNIKEKIDEIKKKQEEMHKASLALLKKVTAEEHQKKMDEAYSQLKSRLNLGNPTKHTVTIKPKGDKPPSESAFLSDMEKVSGRTLTNTTTGKMVQLLPDGGINSNDPKSAALAAIAAGYRKVQLSGGKAKDILATAEALLADPTSPIEEIEFDQALTNSANYSGQSEYLDAVKKMGEIQSRLAAKKNARETKPNSVFNEKPPSELAQIFNQLNAIENQSSHKQIVKNATPEELAEMAFALKDQKFTVKRFPMGLTMSDAPSYIRSLIYEQAGRKAFDKAYGKVIANAAMVKLKDGLKKDGLKNFTPTNPNDQEKALQEASELAAEFILRPENKLARGELYQRIKELNSPVSEIDNPRFQTALKAQLITGLVEKCLNSSSVNSIDFKKEIVDIIGQDTSPEEKASIYECLNWESNHGDDDDTKIEKWVKKVNEVFKELDTPLSTPTSNTYDSQDDENMIELDTLRGGRGLR
jgi:hypothetical protein